MILFCLWPTLGLCFDILGNLTDEAPANNVAMLA
jgi:hypothetical protein